MRRDDEGHRPLQGVNGNPLPEQRTNIGRGQCPHRPEKRNVSFRGGNAVPPERRAYIDTKRNRKPVGVDAHIDPKNGTYYSVGQGLAPAETVTVHRGDNAVPPERRAYTDMKTKTITREIHYDIQT